MLCSTPTLSPALIDSLPQHAQFTTCGVSSWSSLVVDDRASTSTIEPKAWEDDDEDEDDEDFVDDDEDLDLGDDDDEDFFEDDDEDLDEDEEDIEE